MNDLQKLKQLMELWVESYETFCAASYLLGNAWKSYHQRGQGSSEDKSLSFQVASCELDNIFQNMQQDISPIIKNTFSKRCIKPVVNILSLVPTVQDLIQERKTLLLDFDAYKSRIQKEHAAGRDSTHRSVAKKAAKLDESAKKLHTVQTTINRTFHEFETARPESLGFELSAFLACVHSIASNLSNSTAKLLPILPQSASTLAIINYNISSIVPSAEVDHQLQTDLQQPVFSITSPVPAYCNTDNNLLHIHSQSAKTKVITAENNVLFDPGSTSSSTKSLRESFPAGGGISDDEEIHPTTSATMQSPPPKPPKHSRSRPNSTALVTTSSSLLSEPLPLPPPALTTILDDTQDTVDATNSTLIPTDQVNTISLQ